MSGQPVQLILLGTPPSLAQRLQRQGWSGHTVATPPPAGWTGLADPQAAGSLPGPRCWLSNGVTPVQLGEHDLLLTTQAAPACAADSWVGIHWQDSPYAGEHGFLLAAGGSPTGLQRAQAVLDALSPAPGGWLHAGGHGAPAYLASLMQQLGNGMAGLASLMATTATAGFNPIWLGQQALLAQLAEQAAHYLAASEGEHYQPHLPLPPLFGLTPPNAAETDSPARKLACLLVWLQESASKPR
ncbi:hypothetical protein [Chitinimonas sp. JJ19]|uniref:hypothetical protein n=1 Tax=Chitinimonas sp. JJ19 TaxID=3109352 RepID=UPI001A56095D|nr:hypothetical protein [Chitinimonas sp.]